jgi:hypothetical protein
VSRKDLFIGGTALVALSIAVQGMATIGTASTPVLVSMAAGAALLWASIVGDVAAWLWQQRPTIQRQSVAVAFEREDDDH